MCPQQQQQQQRAVSECVERVGEKTHLYSISFRLCLAANSLQWGMGPQPLTPQGCGDQQAASGFWRCRLTQPVPALWYRSVCWVDMRTLQKIQTGPLSQILEMKILFVVFESGYT